MTAPQLRLKSGRERSLLRRHPWVFSGAVEEIIGSRVESDDIIFEAPNKALQTYFIKRLGTNVNLANIALQDAIPLETLRLGLRSDTLLLVG